MAPPPPSSSSSSPSSSRASPSRPPLSHHSPHFTPIQECEREEQEDEVAQISCTGKGDPFRHHPTPIHKSDKDGKQSTRKSMDSGSVSEDDRTVSCNKCRPSAREKISVVPLENAGMSRHSSSLASPNSIFKSIISSFTRKSPRTSDTSWTAREEHWKIAVAELSHKLIQATRKRDEAVLEASRLKYSMAELEKKLNKLEVYCHNLKSGLDVCSGNSPYRHKKDPQIELNHFKIRDHDKVIENFLITVAEARSSIRLLSRSLTLQLRQIGGKVYERISLLLQPYDVKPSLSKNPRTLLFYLEALLSKAFFEDFESVGFQKNASNSILNPIERCESNYASFNILQGLTWDEVLNKGTRHFSEEFSKFCDRKMSEIVAMLAWNRAWTEPLLQAFFAASKSVWLVHLLAASVHPSLPIFRVETETRFDSVYMEDMGGDKARRLVPAMVRIMVAPGFYVYGNVVKCKVLCRYSNDHNNNNNNNNSNNNNRNQENKGVPLTPAI